MTGSVSQTERNELWRSSRLIFLTPQVRGNASSAAPRTARVGSHVPSRPQTRRFARDARRPPAPTRALPTTRARAGRRS
eukprot:4928516-Prymnesium_polylepis.1